MGTAEFGNVLGVWLPDLSTQGLVPFECSFGCLHHNIWPCTLLGDLADPCRLYPHRSVEGIHWQAIHWSTNSREKREVWQRVPILKGDAQALLISCIFTEVSLIEYHGGGADVLCSGTACICCSQIETSRIIASDERWSEATYARRWGQ
jgi:hypothetical protein